MNCKLICVIAVFPLAAGTAWSTTITVSLGTQHFTDGQIVGTGTYNTAAAGQPAPFNGLIGSDIFGPNFSALWQFDYALPASQTITAATLVLGMYDVDASAGTMPAVGFALNSSVDLTAAIDGTFTHHGAGKNAEYDVYTLSLPSSAFTTLQTGHAAFGLGLEGPGLGVLGLTPFNGAGLDFSTLNIVTSTAVAVPEPSLAWLTGLAIFAIGMVRIRSGGFRVISRLWLLTKVVRPITTLFCNSRKSGIRPCQVC
ncbi:MAG: hypothetical protein ABI165_19700 [Bryobacteraceae bacterium]